SDRQRCRDRFLGVPVPGSRTTRSDRASTVSLRGEHSGRKGKGSGGVQSVWSKRRDQRANISEQHFQRDCADQSGGIVRRLDVAKEGLESCRGEGKLRTRASRTMGSGNLQGPLITTPWNRLRITSRKSSSSTTRSRSGACWSICSAASISVQMRPPRKKH